MAYTFTPSVAVKDSDGRTIYYRTFDILVTEGKAEEKDRRNYESIKQCRTNPKA